MNDREPPQETSPPGAAGEADERSAEHEDGTESAGTTDVRADQDETAARAAAREAIDEAKRAASEAASKAAAAAREVGKELKDSSAEALEDIRSAAAEAGHRARVVTADVLDRAKSEAARAKDEVSDLRDEAKRAWPTAASGAGEAGVGAGAEPTAQTTVSAESIAAAGAGDATTPAGTTTPSTAGTTEPSSTGTTTPSTAGTTEPSSAGTGTPPNSTPSSTGFDPNLAAALAYVFAPLTGPLFYIVEKQSTFVRFHAMQAILFAAAAIISMSVFLFLIWIPLLGRFMFTMAGLGFIVTWLVAMWKALNYEEFRLPFIGDVARSQVRRRTEDS